MAVVFDPQSQRDAQGDFRGTTGIGDLDTSFAPADDLAGLATVANSSLIVVKELTFTNANGANGASLPLFSSRGDNYFGCGAFFLQPLTGTGNATVTSVRSVTTKGHGVLASVYLSDIQQNASWDVNGLQPAPASYPNTAFNPFVFDGDQILLTISGGNVTAGTVRVYCFYRPLTVGAALTPA